MEKFSGRTILAGKGWRRLTLVLTVPIWFGGLLWMQDRWPPPPRKPDALASCSRYFPENVSSAWGSCESMASPDWDLGSLGAEERANGAELREFARRQRVLECEATRARVEARRQADFAACSALARSPERIAQREREHSARLLSHGLDLAVLVLPILLAPFALVLTLILTLRVGDWVRQGFASQQSATEPTPTVIPIVSREHDTGTDHNDVGNSWRRAILALFAIGGGVVLIVVVSLFSGATSTQAGQYAGVYIAGWIALGLPRLWKWAWKPLPKLHSRTHTDDDRKSE